MSVPVRTLSPEKLECLELELMGTPIRTIAARLKKTVRTIRRWRLLPEYQIEAQRRREERGQGFRDALEALVYPALETLARISADELNDPKDRISAAAKLLDHGAKMHAGRFDRELAAKARRDAEEQRAKEAEKRTARAFRWTRAEEGTDDADAPDPADGPDDGDGDPTDDA